MKIIKFKIMSVSIVCFFEKYIPNSSFSNLLKISIQYNEIKLLKFLKYFGLDCYRKFYLKLTYKNNTSILIKISKSDKDILRKNVRLFNFFINSLNNN